MSWVSVLWLASKIFCLCSTPAIININLSNDNIVLMDYVSNSKLDVDTFYQCPIRWVNGIFGNWKLAKKQYMDLWTKSEHFYASKDDLQCEWLTRSCKRSDALFQKSLLYFRHGESSSTASQLTSPASQKSKALNKVSLLLQDLDLAAHSTYQPGYYCLFFYETCLFFIVLSIKHGLN